MFRVHSSGQLDVHSLRLHKHAGQGHRLMGYNWRSFRCLSLGLLLVLSMGHGGSQLLCDVVFRKVCSHESDAWLEESEMLRSSGHKLLQAVYFFLSRWRPELLHFICAKQSKQCDPAAMYNDTGMSTNLNGAISKLLSTKEAWLHLLICKLTEVLPKSNIKN